MYTQNTPGIVVTPALPSKENLPAEMYDILQSILGATPSSTPRGNGSAHTGSRREESTRLRTISSSARQSARVHVDLQKQDISIGGTRSTVETDEVVVGAPSIRSHRHIPYSESLPQFPFFHDETAVPDTRPVPPTPFDQNPILPDQDNALTQGSVEVDNWSIISVVGDNAPVDDPDSWPETDAEYGSCESLRDSLEEALEQTDGSEVEDYDSSPSAMYASTVPAAQLFQTYREQLRRNRDDEEQAMCFPNIPMSHCISAPPVHTTQDLPIRQRSRRVGSYEPPVDSTRRHAMYISALVWGEGQWRSSTYTDSDTEQEQKRRWREGWNFIKNALKIGPRAPSPRV